MTDIEYSFGTGDGVVHTWSGAADLDVAGTGLFDAVALDFDGDGMADDALWDATGSGVADLAALDLDDDGRPDHFYTDPTGLGTWDHQVSGLPGDSANEPLDWITRTGTDQVGSSVTCDIAFPPPALDRLPEAGEYAGRPGEHRFDRIAEETTSDLPAVDGAAPRP